MILLALIACGTLFHEDVAVPERAAVTQSLTGNFRSGTPAMVRLGESHAGVNASVQPVRFSLRPGFEVSAALWTPERPSGAGVVVAQGHYGQGKSGAEAQEIAHRLASRGAWVLAVDTPGVEEWAVPGRQIHFEAGAHNRAILASRGGSALALQLDILRRGVDVLVGLGATRIGATGASGGAVQAFYLGWLDDRVSTAVMASFPPIPREAAASGCACDHIPGHPGPDPGLLGQWTAPSLWLSDVQQERPEGLPREARFEVLEGPHSFTRAMQVRTLAWFSDELGLPAGDFQETVPNIDLSTGTPVQPYLSIADLPVVKPMTWTPRPKLGWAPRVSCEGDGPVLLTLGAADLGALQAAGWRTCAVSTALPPGASYDESAWTQSVGEGTVMVDSLAGAVGVAEAQHSAVAVWAHRGWGLVASTLRVPFVVHQPVRDLAEVEQTDPPWIHVPGAWEGVATERLELALAAGPDAASLVQALDVLKE